MNIPVIIGKSPTLKGIRGVLAAEDIPAGTLIEACPVIPVPAAEQEAIGRTVFDHYVYEWDAAHDCLVLGYCGLVNHSYTPNARYERHYGHQTMEYYALTDIPAGTEILVNYNGDPENREPLDAEYTDFRH